MDDFLYVLKAQLENQLTAEQVEYQIALYRAYIIEEKEAGKTEEQVMRKLGDPIRVSEMIVDSYRKKEAKETAEKKEFQDMTDEEINAQMPDSFYGIHAEFKKDEGWDIRIGKLKLNSWYGTFLILGIVLAIFILLSFIFPGLRLE